MAEWEVAVAILMASFAYIMYRIGVGLDEEHWPIKLTFFYGCLFLGWVVINTALRFAVDYEAPQATIDSVQLFYVGYLWIVMFAVAYLVIRVFWYFAEGMIQTRSMKKEMESAEFF